MIPSTIRNILRAKEFFRAQDPEFDTKPQPVIATPMWFVEEVQALYSKNPDGPDGEILDEIHGMKIIERPEISEPLVVLADGRYCNVVPTWARAVATNAQAKHIAVSAAAPVELPGRDDPSGDLIGHAGVFTPPDQGDSRGRRRRAGDTKSGGKGVDVSWLIGGELA